MKMIYAIVRPEKVYEVNKALADAGYGASTKWSVAGRGKQHGIQVGELVYDEMSKNMLMIVCDDDDMKLLILSWIRHRPVNPATPAMDESLSCR